MFAHFFKSLNDATHRKKAYEAELAAVKKALEEIRKDLTAQTTGIRFVPNAGLGYSLAENVRDILIGRVLDIKIEIVRNPNPRRDAFFDIGLFHQDGMARLVLVIDYVEQASSGTLKWQIIVYRD